MALMISLQ